jgi:hypothetical protein
MTKTKHEKPQKGNPHRLTVKQHVFPAKSIERFANPQGIVMVADALRKHVRPAKLGDLIFCARRAWDQRAEAGYMRRIEDAFQALADKIIDGSVSEIGEAEKLVVNDFYSLWHVRARRRNLKEQDIQMKGVTGENLTPDQAEILESKGIIFLRKGGKLPTRHINGMQMQILIDRQVEALAQAQWGIIQAQEGEFVVPDVPIHSIVPLTPTRCLVSPAPCGMILKKNVAEINRSLITASHEYFFARDFSKCPS